MQDLSINLKLNEKEEIIINKEHINFYIANFFRIRYCLSNEDIIINQ